MPKAKASTNGDSSESDHPSGIMMILSPAKTLDLKPLPETVPSVEYTLPLASNLDKTTEIAKEMKRRSQAELAKLLGISSNLAQTSHEYWKNFEQDLDLRPDDETKPCIYAFSGAAYQGLQALECSKESILYLQDNLRIVDPLYGVLRPLDKMQPYRLEMATKNVFGGANKTNNNNNKPTKLNEYWKPAVTQCLCDELNQRPANEQILLNLASDEYAAAVDASELNEKTPDVKYVKAVFRDQGRVVAVHAKRARGLMARFLAETQAKTLEDIQEFAEEGYKFVAKDSDETTVVFDRPKQEKKAAPKSAAAKRPATTSTAASKKRDRKPSN